MDMLYSARAISPFLKAHHGSTRITPIKEITDIAKIAGIAN